MRRRALIAACALLLVACSDDARPSASSASSSASVTTTTVVTTTAPPTTASPLAPIAGCPDPGPLAEPDPNRPSYFATAEVDVANGTVEGGIKVRFTPDLPTNELVFRLWPNSPVLAAAGVHEDVPGVTRVDGVALAVDRPDDTTVHVTLPETLAAGSSIQVTVPFSLRVPGPSPDRIAHDGDTMRLGSFLPLLAWEPGGRWARGPAPSVHAEAATSPVADYHVALTTTDPTYDVLGSGVRGPTDGDWRAIAVRDVAYSIGHFAIAEADVGGVHLTVGVDRSVNEDPQHYLALDVDSFTHYPARLGAYPWPTYTAAVLPGFSGGIEFPTHVMHAAGSSTRSIVHEVAHQWFYSLVGNDQGRDPWLDEGLASYVEFVEVDSLARHESESIPSDGRGHAGDPMTYWEHHQSSYYPGVYVQSAVAVARLGTADQVDCALREYVAHTAFRIATTADLFAALTSVFPDAADRLAPYGLHP